jgi:hypothetical protein
MVEASDIEREDIPGSWHRFNWFEVLNGNERLRATSNAHRLHDEDLVLSLRRYFHDALLVCLNVDQAHLEITGLSRRTRPEDRRARRG